MTNAGRICKGKIAALSALMLAGLLLMTGCYRSFDARYTNAQELLALGEYETALRELQTLGEYRDSGKLALYASGLLALEKGNYALAQTDFENLEDFKNSGLYAQYVEARQLQQEEDYEAAQSAYQLLGSFRDSRKRMETCTAMIPQKAYEQAQALYDAGEYEQAMSAFLALKSYYDSPQKADACQQAILNKAYQDASSLLKRKAYREALAAFSALGSYRDSSILAESCRQALYQAAEAALKEGGLVKAQEAIALYESLETYGDASRKAQELKGKYAINMRLRGYQEGWQYVALGTFPAQEGGEKASILWRVLCVDSGAALLLADKILDTAAMGTGASFSGYAGSSLQTYLNGAFLTEAFTSAQQAALQASADGGKVFLLSKEEAMDPGLGFASDSARQALGTEYALSKGLHASSAGYGWWWLSSKGTDESCQAIIYYNGVVYGPGRRFDDSQTGVRPAIRIKLDSLFFTAGSGTAADPFR